MLFGYDQVSRFSIYLGVGGTGYTAIFCAVLFQMCAMAVDTSGKQKNDLKPLEDILRNRMRIMRTSHWRNQDLISTKKLCLMPWIRMEKQLAGRESSTKRPPTDIAMMRACYTLWNGYTVGIPVLLQWVSMRCIASNNLILGCVSKRGVIAVLTPKIVRSIMWRFPELGVPQK